MALLAFFNEGFEMHRENTLKALLLGGLYIDNGDVLYED